MFRSIKSELYFYKAQSFAVKKKYKEAINAFKKAIDAKPLRFGPHLQYGLTLAENESYEQALFELNEAQKLAPQNSVITMFRGEVFMKKGDCDKSLKALNRSLEMCPDNHLCLALKGLALLYLKKYEEGCQLAIENYASGNKWFRTSLISLCELLCMDNGMNSFAMLEKISIDSSQIFKQPKNKKIIHNFITKLYSISYFLDYITIIPFKLFNKDQYKFQKTLLYALQLIEAGDYEKAIPRLLECAEIDTVKRSSHIFTICNLLYLFKEYDATLEIIEQHIATQQDPPPEFVILKAKILTHKQKTNEASALLNCESCSKSVDFWFYYLKALYYLQNNNINKAYEYFDNAISCKGMYRIIYLHIIAILNTQRNGDEITSPTIRET